MSGRRQHFVADRPRLRRRASALPRTTANDPPYRVACGVRNTVLAKWEVERFGPLDAPWSPSQTTTSIPERKLAHVVEIADSYLAQISHGRWSIYLDDDHRPAALLLSHAGGPCEVVRVQLQGRLIYLGPTPLSLAAREVGPRLIELIASRCGGYFGSL